MRAWRLIAVGVVAVAVAACAPGGESTPERVAPLPPRGAPSSSFAVGHVPDGYQITAAGQGSWTPDWGSDDVGTVEPLTVLEREGASALVSVTGYEGYQGGLDQAASGYACEGRVKVRRLTVDGQRARFTPAADQCGERNELLVDRGHDLAVRVVAAGWSQDQLVAVERGVEPAPEHQRAPAVAPPSGWRILGSVDADVRFSLQIGAPSDGRLPTIEHAPGPVGAHVIAWADGDALLSVLTLPGADTAGLLGLPGHESHREGDDIVMEAERSRVLVRRAPWGDLLVVTSLSTTLPTAELQAVAASVERVAPARWDEFLIDATGGPGLHVDPDAVEVVRGEDWLLQARPSVVIPGAYDADECLKLASHRLACADAGSFGAGPRTWVSYARPAGGEPGFILVVTERESGGEVRATSGPQRVTAPLVRLPGSPTRWAAIALLDNPGLPGDCGQANPAALDVTRVELVSGATTTCLRP